MYFLESGEICSPILMERIGDNTLDNREDNKWTVYIHTSPSGKYYVGMTGGKPKARWGKNGNGYKDNHYFFRAIQKYGWDNFEHEIISSNITKKEASDFEIYLIEILKLNNQKYGYNITAGGECGIAKPLRSVYQYNLNGEYIKSFESGASASREVGCHRTQITKVCKGKGFSICGYMWRYYKADKIEVYSNSTCVQVNQYDNKNNLIKSYSSITDASIETGISICCISNCYRHKTKTAGGFIWTYSHDNI